MTTQIYISNNSILYDKKTINNGIVLILLFLIWPFGALPLVFYEIYHGKRYALSLLAIFLGLWGLLIPPSGDIYRYTLDYIYLKDTDITVLKDFCEYHTDYLLYIILWILGKCDIPCDFYRFIYVYISSELLFCIYYDFCKRQNLNRKVRFLIFVIFFLNYNFTAAVIRNGFSNALYFYGLYNIIIRKNNYGWISVIFAILNHLSFIAFGLLLLIVVIFKYKGSKKFTGIAIIGIFLFSGNILDKLLTVLPFDEQTINHLMAYTDGYLAGEYLNDHSMLFKINRWINRLPKILCYILFWKYFMKSSYSGLIDLMLLIVMIVSPYEIVRGRFENVPYLPILFFILYRLPSLRQRVQQLILYSLLSFGIIISGTYFWTERRSRAISKHSIIFYQPVFSIITTEYSIKWIQQNINSDGNMAKNI